MALTVALASAYACRILCLRPPWSDGLVNSVPLARRRLCVVPAACLFRAHSRDPTCYAGALRPWLARPLSGSVWEGAAAYTDAATC